MARTTSHQQVTKNKVHLSFDTKYDGIYNARCVDYGNLTDIHLNSGIPPMTMDHTFFAKVNKLNIKATDIGNTYLEAETSEKVLIIVGPEFGRNKDLS